MAAQHCDRLTFEILQARLRRDGYTVTLHEDSTAEISAKVVKGATETYISLFSTGKIRVAPHREECEKLRDEIIEHVRDIQNGVHQRLGKEAFEFLEPADKDNVLVSRMLCERSPSLIEYSVLVMPLAKAFEGFAKKLLVRLNIGDPLRIDDPGFFRETFGGAAYQAIPAGSQDKKALERIRTELPFSRHGLMHSPTKPAFIFRDHAQAIAKEGDILTLMRETVAHFSGRI